MCLVFRIPKQIVHRLEKYKKGITELFYYFMILCYACLENVKNWYIQMI